MAQFYTKERSVGNATAKIYDDSQRILQQSEQLIESMRAVNSYEERQQATLINNLRAHRQQEKEKDTRNHKLLMDNMRQVFEVQDQNNLNDLEERKRKIAQKERTLETIASLSMTAAKTVGKIREGIIEEERKTLNELNTERLRRAPQTEDGEVFGYDSQERERGTVEAAMAATASLEKLRGQDRSFWSKLLVSEGTLEKLRYEVVMGNKVDSLVRGGLQDILRNRPNETVEITDPYTGQKQVVSYSSINTLDSSEKYSRALHAVIGKELDGVKGEVSAIVFNKAYAKINQYVNTKTLAYSDKLDKDNTRNLHLYKQNLIGIADGPEEAAKETVSYVAFAQLSPDMDAASALNVINTRLLPTQKDPVAYAEAVNKLAFPHLTRKRVDKDGKTVHEPVPIGDTPFGELLEQEAKRIQLQKDKQYLATENAKGDAFSLAVVTSSLSDNNIFDFAEYNEAYEEVDKQVGLGNFSDEAAYRAKIKLDDYYRTNKNSNLVKAHLEDLARKQELTPYENNLAYFNGDIDRQTWKSNEKIINELLTVKLPNGLRYNSKNVRSYYYSTTSKKIGQFDVSGRAKHFSAGLAADIAVDMYIKRYEQLLNDPDTNYTAAQAAEQAFNDIQAKIDNEEGTFFVDRTDSARGNIYAKLTPGTHTGAPRQVPIPSVGAREVGLTLRGEGISKLNDTDFPGLTQNYAVHRERVRNGLPLKPTAYEQELADASGYSFRTIVNKMLEANGEEIRAEGGSYDVLTEQVPKENPELRRVLDSPKTWGKLSFVTDRSPHLMPAKMCTQGLGFCNADSIARKLNHPNSEAIAALWYSKTNGGVNPGFGSPMQQIQQIIEDNPQYDMQIDYSQVAQFNPEIVPIMQQYGDSHVPIAGMSKTMRRTHSVLHNNPVDRGGLFNLIGGGESSMDALVFNTGTTNSTGRFPNNSTFASVEKAQSEGSAFAAGSWQGTPGVLNQGRVAAGLPDNANFNSLNNQSRAFWGLLLNTNKRPALKAYLLGESDDINAAHLDLANEFAAIEGPSGKGSYDGDSAGNKANTKASQVQAALQQARKDLASNPINFN